MGSCLLCKAQRAPAGWKRRRACCTHHNDDGGRRPAVIAAAFVIRFVLRRLFGGAKLAVGFGAGSVNAAVFRIQVASASGTGGQCDFGSGARALGRGCAGDVAAVWASRAAPGVAGGADAKGQVGAGGDRGAGAGALARALGGPAADALPGRGFGGRLGCNGARAMTSKRGVIPIALIKGIGTEVSTQVAKVFLNSVWLLIIVRF